MANTHSIDLELSSSQFLSITDGNQTGLDLSGDYTIEAWIKLEQLPSTSGTTFIIAGKYAATGNQRSYRIQINSDDTLVMVAHEDGSSVNRNVEQSDSAIVVSGDVGNWVHIAVSHDLSDRSGVMYKNGSSVASTSAPNGTMASVFNGTADYVIGAESGGSNFFDGKIDEVRQWSDIRTASEIADNRLIELTGSEAGLVAYWKLNNDLLDETSNDNDLTNNNSAVFSTDVPFPLPPVFKTINGVAKASVKTGNTVAIANIRTWDTSTLT